MPAGEPVFAEPWQASVLAMAQLLAERGAVAPSDWSATLGAALRDGQPSYYEAALAALERVILAAGMLMPEEIEARVAVWREAYLLTPHGQPVRLRAGQP
jgi:hypothetical protein